MNKIFNTPFEISLRILLTLEANRRQWVSIDMIAALDFMTVYSKGFGINSKNLHGENAFKFSEYALRRELVQIAIKRLVLDDLIDASYSKKGFSFSINHNGLDYCSKFESTYAVQYRQLAQQVQVFVANKSELETIELINRYSVSSLQRRK